MYCYIFYAQMFTFFGDSYTESVMCFSRIYSVLGFVRHGSRLPLSVSTRTGRAFKNGIFKV